MINERGEREREKKNELQIEIFKVFFYIFGKFIVSKLIGC